MDTFPDSARLREIEAQVEQLIRDCGIILGETREAKHFSQERVASAIPNLDAGGLSKFERGTGRITLKTFFWLVLLYDIPWEQLFANLPPSTRQLLATAILQVPEELQESLSRLLWYGLGQPLPARNLFPLPELRAQLSLSS